MAIQKKPIKAIRDFLERRNKTAFSMPTEHGKTLAIEIQDWRPAGNFDKLFAGYWEEVNGDQVPSPNLEILIVEGQASARIHTGSPFDRPHRDDGVANLILKGIVEHLATEMDEVAE